MRNSYYFRHDLESPLGYRLEVFLLLYRSKHGTFI